MDRIEDTYRQRRVGMGMTQDRVAVAAGVSRKTVSDFENGRAKISLANLNRLLRAIGLELATREAAAPPTFDELEKRYGGDDAPPRRQRARRKNRQ